MPVSANPPTLSAEECHSLLVKAHRLGKRARHRFIRILLHVQQSRLHLLLGYSSIYQCSEAKFRYSPTQTAEFLRVAKALLRLPRSAAAFDAGTIPWSALELYSRVAVEATEGEWIRFVKKRSLGQLRAEVEDAIQKGRDRPRKDTHSLPRLMVRVVHLFTPEEHAVYQKAVAKDQGELSRSLGGKDGAVPTRGILAWVVSAVG